MTVTVASTFAGVGGFDLAAQRAGMRLAWQCEIDRAAAGVLERHWPQHQRCGDIGDISDDAAIIVGGEHAGEATRWRPTRVDVLCGGFPCQDLSVAGARRGLAGARSGLFFELVRLARVLSPRWLLFENVPGLLSSNGGRDMGTVVGALVELGYGVAWRVLDAQFFGVPQRRERVFIVGCAGGDALGAASVLFESARLPWDPPPSREAGEEAPRGSGDGATGCGVAGRHGLERVGGGVPAEEGGLIAGPLGSQPKGGGWRDDTDRATFVAATVTASAGHHGHSSPRGDGGDNLVVGALTGRADRGGTNSEGHDNHLVVAATLTAGTGITGNAPGRRREDDENLVVASFQQNSLGGRGSLGFDPDTKVLRPVKPQADHQMVAFGLRSDAGRTGEAKTPSPDATGNVAGGVRRLMPIECERLQGFPDGWTETGADGKAQSDAARYRQIGNAVAVPVVEWLFRRLVAADAALHGETASEVVA